MGDALLANCMSEVEPLAEDARSARGTAQWVALDFDREFGGVRIVGRVTSHPEEGQIGWHPGNLGASRRIGAWVRHLAFQLVAAAGMPRRSVLHALDDKLVLAPCDDAELQLERLAGTAQRAMCEALPFFPRSALAYAEQAAKGAPEKALDAARAVWLGNAWQGASAECEDPYFKLAFRGAADPLGEEFQRLALEIFSPLLACSRDDDEGAA